MSAVEKHPESCIICGHCVAICPVEAIQHEKMPMDEFHPVQNPNITLEQFNHLAQNRRSTRRFKDKALEHNHINEILNSVRCVPTGSNLQELRYLVITNPDVLTEIRLAMAKKFKLAKSITNNGLIYGILKLFLGKAQADYMAIGSRRIYEQHLAGEDPFLRGVKALIIIHTKTKTPMAHLDAGIAGYHINLACETMGIGTCWIGFHSEIASNFKSFRNLSRVPKGHKVLATIGLGYPVYKYRKTCYRNPLKITEVN
jgi:nitroreductase